VLTVRFPVGVNVASRRRLANGFRCAWRSHETEVSFELSRDGRTLLRGCMDAGGRAGHELVDPAGDIGIAWWHWLAVARSLAAERGLPHIEVQIGSQCRELLSVAALHFDAVLVSGAHEEVR